MPDPHSPTNVSRRQAIAWLAAAGGLTPGAVTAAPGLMLAQNYTSSIDLGRYGVSEKYDGLRGYWDGQALWTRGGERVHAPAWFTAGWPGTPLDGELWAGRGRFETAVGIARTRSPDPQAWKPLRYMVFDLPAHPGRFRERHGALAALVPAGGPMSVVEQATVGGHAALRALLARTVREGGEGLMLHRWDATYRAGRSDAVLKYKPEDDDDARVLEHLPGEGRHAGVMGALLVETPQGLRFRIGSGFTDVQRRQPPRVGSWVSYRYRGRTGAGVPRFATFLRERPDLGE